VDAAIAGGGDPKDVPVPREVPNPQADRILHKAHDKVQERRRRERIEAALRDELAYEKLSREEKLQAFLRE
jgi:hypothetical protein